jgi:glycosyltransferase involved in cell wall biosynthesis
MHKSILMISESPYPEDVRIKHEAETLYHAGHPVTIIALNEQNARFAEVINGVKVYRLPMITIFPKSSSDDTWFGRLVYRLTSGMGYVLEYIYFTLLSFAFSLYVYFRHGFEIVHLHNPPNTLVLVAGFYKLLGKRFVFDHHDLAPELYLSKYRIEKPDLLYKLLRLEEIACLKLADMVIATNRSYAEIDVRRGQIKENKITIVRNGPDLEKFHRVPEDAKLKQSGRQILAYVGIMGPQDGIDYLLKALAHLVHDLDRRNILCIVIGKGDALADLQHLAQELRLDGHVRFTGFIPRSDLLRYLSTADICLDPNPSSPLNDVSTWIKVMEYMAMAKPVVSFDLKETRYSAGQAALYVPPNDIRAYARAIAALLDDPEKRLRMGAYGYRRVREKLAWPYSAARLVNGYRGLEKKPIWPLQAIRKLKGR